MLILLVLLLQVSLAFLKLSLVFEDLQLEILLVGLNRSLYHMFRLLPFASYHSFVVLVFFSSVMLEPRS